MKYSVTVKFKADLVKTHQIFGCSKYLAGTSWSCINEYLKHKKEPCRGCIPIWVFVKDFRVPKTLRRDHVMKEFRDGVTKVLWKVAFILFIL